MYTTAPKAVNARSPRANLPEAICKNCLKKLYLLPGGIPPFAPKCHLPRANCVICPGQIESFARRNEMNEKVCFGIETNFILLNSNGQVVQIPCGKSYNPFGQTPHFFIPSGKWHSWLRSIDTIPFEQMIQIASGKCAQGK